MQNKYLSALKTKYANFGLSKEALDRVALQRVKTIANESEIEQDLASPETFLLLMKEQQGANDSLRSSNKEYQKQLESLKSSTTPPTEPAPIDNPYKEQFEEMQRMHKEMMDKFAANEKKVHDDAILVEVHEKMKSMGCTNDYIRKTTLAGLQIGENDTADGLAEKYKSVYDANCKDAFGEGFIPPKGGNGGGIEVDYSAMVAGLQASGNLPK